MKFVWINEYAINMEEVLAVDLEKCLICFKNGSNLNVLKDICELYSEATEQEEKEFYHNCIVDIQGQVKEAVEAVTAIKGAK